METIILVAGFLGAWLLVAGSVYQAALELRDEDVSNDHLREVGANTPRPPRVSAWWWFVPPVKLILEKRNNDAFRKTYFEQLSKEDSEAMLSFMNKATAWLYVGLGGFLLAVKETYELDVHFHAHLVFFFIAIVLLAIISVGNTAVRIRRSEDILNTKK